MYCFNVFLGYTTEQWAQFVASHVMGAFSLAWVSGISYMVSTTLSVLQLREILHPSILAKMVRPQEPHIDLLISLMTESIFVHTRRILSSMFIYVTIIVFFVYFPLYLCRSLFFPNGPADVNLESSDFQIDTIITAKLYFCYYVSQIQIPFELAFAHLTFLTLLDKKKNVIGRLQHNWLVFICAKLGMSRFILPHALRRADGEDSPYGEGSGEMIVGPPMRRPPAGWDSRTQRNTVKAEPLCINCFATPVLHPEI